MADDINIISPNMIKLFEECKRKFYFRYIEQIPSPILDKGFEIGKNIHSLASYYLRGYNIDKFEKNLTSKESDYWKNLKNNQYFTYEIVGVEKNITSKIGDFWVGGRIDSIVRNGDDYFILDYKTGGVDNSNDKMVYDSQTMIYLMMCDSLYPVHKGLNFVYLDLKNNKEVSIPFSDRLKAEYSEKIINICSQITKFSLKSPIEKTNCKCEYLRLCQNLL